MPYVVSFPCEGRTWLLTMLEGAGFEGMTFTHLWHNEHSPKPGEDPRAALTGIAAQKVYLGRNPWDTMCSWHAHTRYRAQAHSLSLSEFIRVPHLGIEAWVTHTEARLDYPGLWVLYRKIHEDPERELRRVFGFLGIQKFDIAAGVEAGRFETMRDDPQYGPTNPHPDSYKVRRGKVGGFREDMLPGDVAYIAKRLTPRQRRMHEEVLA